MTMKRGLLAVGLLILTSGVTSADTILNARPCSPPAPCTDQGWLWEYTFEDPTGDTDWATTAIWNESQTGHAPFGNNTGGFGGDDPNGYFDYETFWPVDATPNPNPDGDDLWVRTTINLSGYFLDSIAYNLGVDNGYALYVNGNLVASGNAEGYTSRWEYSGTIPSAFLTSGDNYVALALEDHGGLTAFDMEITGAPVPEPGTLALLGGGLVVLRSRLRRRKQG
jgi:hypothetical protein